MEQSTAPAVTEPTKILQPQGEQLSLRFFGVIEGMHGCPPDRGLWRLLVDMAIDGVEAFTHRGRRVSGTIVLLVAYRLYMESNRAGIVENLSEASIARRCQIDRKTLRAALGVLRDFRVIRRVPGGSRRRPGTWRLNLGGLDFPAIRARAQGVASGGTMPLLTAPVDASGGTMPQLSGGTMPPLLGTYKGHDVRTAGSETDPAPLFASEIARDPAPAFDTGSAFLPVCPSCRQVAVEVEGEVCSRCCAAGSPSKRDPTAPAYLAAGDYLAAPSADFNQGH